MAKRSSMRASDADRDRVTERLRQAAAEGRLLAHELEERLARALRAQTYGDLDAVVDDLPGTPTPMERPAPRGLTLIRRYPLAAVVLVFVAAIALVAMAVAALAALASMIWIVAIFAFFGFRTRGIRRRSRRHLDDQRMYVHVRRYGRF